MTTIKSKLLFSIVLLSTIVLFTSCKKDDDNNSSSSSSSSGNNNNTSCTFFPYKDGSVIEEEVNGSSYVFPMQDTTIKGVTYLYSPNAVSSGIQAGLGFAREGSNGEVIQYVPSQNLNGIIIPEMDATFLKPNESVGATWSNSASFEVAPGYTYSSIYNYEIVDKGFSETVLGTSYSNCIKVKLVLATSVAGTTVNSPAVYYYYACGFGFYKVEDADGNVTAKVTKLTI